MPKLFLKLKSPARHDDEGYHLDVAWQIRENDHLVRADGVTDFRGLSDLIDPAADWLNDPANIVVFVPAERVLSLRCEVPGRSAGHIRRALPFVVEEFVATDIEAMHLAHGPIRRGEPVLVSLIDRLLLEGWLEALSALGIKPGHMLSEAELLPLTEGGASLLFDGDEVIVKTADQAASVDRDNLLLALGTGEFRSVTVINGSLTDMERGQLAPEVEVETLPSHADSAFEYLIERWGEGVEGLNLLQGSYAPRKTRSPGLERWRAVAVLAGIWLVVALGGLTTQAFWASTRADALEEQSTSLYREIFPGDQRITNVRRQMQQKLGERVDGTGASFTDYVGYLAQGLDRNASILSLSYTESRNELGADLLLKNYDELEHMKQRLGQLGVEVEITSAEQQDTGVRARLRLKGA